MSIKLFILALFFFITIVLVNVQSVFAITTPDFPACTNPQGSIRSQHNDGVHGVIGNSAEFKGKDTVYTVNENQVLQCLCTTDSQGIQTNWWKISSLTDLDIQVLKNSGWYYVPNGSLWGLENTPYMAKNSNYECNGTSLGIGGGDILALATTGNMSRWFYALIGIGVMFALFGLLLNLRRGK